MGENYEMMDMPDVVEDTGVFEDTNLRDYAYDAYYKHYIKTRDDSAIIDYWSSGPHCDRDTTGAVCINEQGGYQFQFTPDGEVNPNIFDSYGVPIYGYENGEVVKRSDEAIQAEIDAIPEPGPSELETLKEQLADSQRQTTDLQLAYIELYEQLEVMKNGG